jgi:hypothetical protein
MIIVQLIYISTIVGTPISQIPNFVESARERNKIRDITSLMLVTEKCYIHCIEGSRLVVSDLYNKISNDPRHSQCTILRLNEMSRREFSNFSAEISVLSEFGEAEVNTICDPRTIDPFTITSSAAMSLLRRVAAHHHADKIESNLSY